MTFPQDYKPLLDQSRTEQAIKQIKDFFQQNLASELRLKRVTAPLFILKGMGLNDDLSGVENPVSFHIKDMGGQEAEIVHSLAKWKRITLAEYKIAEGHGIYTDMNAIRADETLDNLHSLYVDQWDWEKVIREEDRTLDYLTETVKGIYSSLLRTEYMICESFPEVTPELPSVKELYFIHAEELRRMYPALTAKEREDAITKKHKAVFIIGIGCRLNDGSIHDSRSADYDDYSTITKNGLPGLNGDLLVWDNVLERSMELSSMGIRVDKKVLLHQLKEAGQEHKEQLYFHKRLINGELPLSIGGGIGQSRLCMYLLRKAHIGEIQASIWPDEMRKKCAANNIILL